MAFFWDSVLLGLQYALLALGVYITFRVLNIPDLTVDGSFTLGMAISVVLAAAGYPFEGLLLALLAGAGAGIITGFLQTKMRIHPILAGILTMSGLYTVNITIMGSPNISLIEKSRFYELFYNIALWFKGEGAVLSNGDKTALKFIAMVLICALLVFLLSQFFKTVLGLCIRATGNNADMVRASSINTTMTKITAIALANALVALSGGITAQFQGFGDINAGSGMIVIGFASVIIGEVLFGRRSLTIGLISAVTGSVLYRIIIAIALKTNIISANALKLISALIVAAVLCYPAVKDWRAARKLKREGMKHA